MTAEDYGKRVVTNEFRAVPQKGGPDVPVPVGSIVEARHNRNKDEPLLLFRWDGQNYKTEATT